jgi:hypothetical protein
MRLTAPAEMFALAEINSWANIHWLTIESLIDRR